jgi:hypothetical protein
LVANHHQKSSAINHRVPQTWRFQRLSTSRNFFWLVCKNRNALALQQVSFVKTSGFYEIS